MNSLSFSLRFLHPHKAPWNTDTLPNYEKACIIFVLVFFWLLFYPMMEKEDLMSFLNAHAHTRMHTHTNVTESYYLELPCRYKTFTDLILMKASWKTLCPPACFYPCAEDFFGYKHCYFKLNPHTLMHTQALTLKTVFITWDLFF